MASDDPGFSAEHEQVMAGLVDAILPASEDGRMPGGAALGRGVPGVSVA